MTKRFVEKQIVDNLVPPPTNRGAEKVKTCISEPAVAEPTAHHTFRATFVTALAKLRSLGARSDAT